MGDRRHPHRHVEFLERDVAVQFAERRLGLDIFGVDQALDDELGLGRHQKIDGAGAHHVDGRAGEPARDGELVEVDGEFLRPQKGDQGRAAEHDRARHGLVAALLVLEVMLVSAGAADPRRHAHDEAVGRLQRARGRCPCSGRRSRDRG